MLENGKIESYIAILKEELVLATGCTEPISIAYAAALLAELLGGPPERIEASVSGNILKNVKSVVVPGTGGLKGIGAAIAAGVVAGKPRMELQVIAHIQPEQQAAIETYANNTPLDIVCAETPYLLDIVLRGVRGEHSAKIRIANHHSNVVLMEKDNTVLREKPLVVSSEDGRQDKSLLNVQDIVEFANCVDTTLVAELLDRQIQYNQAIAEEGLAGNWGANIGSVLLQEYGEDVHNKARAYAAAGSDARMSGCEMPVVILSGSGNQGMTASLPVICFARHLGASQEQLYRALLVSDLVTIHQKTGIGRLSAYCGAVSAGVGAGAGVAYLLGGDCEAISHTIVNAVAILSGTICDGAKPSCAAKIAAAVDAGLLGYSMYRHNQEFKSGDGIVTKGVDNTIHNVGLLAREGMQETDRTILQIMTQQPENPHLCL